MRPARLLSSHLWRACVPMKKILGLSAVATGVLFAAFIHFVASSAVGQSGHGCTDQALALAQGQLTHTLAYTSTSQFPTETDPANLNKWNLAGPSNWTSGFFPGSLWYM